ncbi:TetR/AcrR family transcriptional regulator [Gordonia rhizosphera]|uniref:Putative TetR family transcriptional regulator n=1 Tax=Gordonia rhizosphera NBRC 16068 TaxID=1108045 RepID=K6V1H7_9ACTN|nr:TetR/AcrR family transcriptional regulator [Gordonia rhizosphera]GAB89778.1 putative TetR family transcriptional regulator [Gordonia rhizosphera NBRC 16068]
MATEVRSAKERLILTAERLYALRGLDGVALRQIGLEAGMANKSAVQYHFGSKNGLVRAILANRMDDLDRRRALLLARVRPGDLRGVVEAHHLPLIELGEDEDCFYLQFVEQLEQKVHPLYQLPAANQQVEQHYFERVGTMLTDVPESLRLVRILQASAMCLHACADRHRMKVLGEKVPPYAVHVSQLLDTLVAVLIVEPSTETVVALESWMESGG